MKIMSDLHTDRLQSVSNKSQKYYEIIRVFATLRNEMMSKCFLGNKTFARPWRFVSFGFLLEKEQKKRRRLNLESLVK